MKRIEKSIDVELPVDQCLNYWIENDSFPGRAHHVESQEDVLEWEDVSAQSLYGDDTISRQNATIKKTLWFHRKEDNHIDISGIITFKSIPFNNTRITITMTLNSPAMASGGEYLFQSHINLEELVIDSLAGFKQTMHKSAYLPLI